MITKRELEFLTTKSDERYKKLFERGVITEEELNKTLDEIQAIRNQYTVQSVQIIKEIK